MKSHSELISLIEKFPQPTTFKAADTGKYIFSNVANSKNYGVLFPEELVGLTVHDLNFAQPAWRTRFAQKITELDLRVREEKTLVTGKRSMLLNSGAILYEELVKFPVLDASKRVLGIVSYTQDLTVALSGTELYRQYLCVYNKLDAIQRVLVHLKVDASFTLLPTEAQFRVFLEKAQGYENKEIAKRLGFSPRTVETHLAALRNKVVGDDLRRALSLAKRRTAPLKN
jgi:Bacterial regulatory proteins, luxR family/PAS fold